MRKSNIDNLWSLGFMRICFANFLLFASIYMLFPVLPSVMMSRLGISTGQAGSMFLVFAAAMFLVGPFHAYLGDEYKRKRVLVYSIFVILGTTLGYIFVDTFPRLLMLAAVQGGAFGLAATAGITVAIDITTASCRKSGLCTGSPLGYAGRSGSGNMDVSAQRFQYDGIFFYIMQYIQYSICIAGICSFPCTDRSGALQSWPFFVVAGLASRPQFGTDCFYSRDCIIVNQTRGLCCTVFSRCSGSAYDTFYEDIC